MAGIFVNVNDDIQNLRKLKEEINEVKKALKGIDIDVNLNIKEGLEAQLRTLTEQYDALATKISETEGKIRVSTQRINETTNKIIEAQNKLVGAAKEGGATQTTASTNAETLSVQAQAKAYDDLKAEIDAVLGSRSENVKRMVDEQNAIRLINLELKQMEKSTVGGNYSPAQLQRIQQLNDALLTHKAALAEVRIQLNNNAKMDNAAADSMEKLSLELGRMRSAYRELTKEEKASPFGRELLASIEQVDAKLKEFDASIGNYQRNVGNYGGGFNGLNVSVQQIVRELPSAAIGLNTFFLAISNNIPILVDEIKRAQVANEALKKSGGTAVPVWKQLAGSLFSWQTALMAGISLMTIYGKDIANWISNLFNGKTAVNSLEEAQRRLNESYISESSGLGEQVALIKKLSNEWKSLGNNTRAQEKYIRESQEKFNDLGVSITNVSEAENLLVNNTTAYINALQQRARATAAMKFAAEQSERSLAKQLEIEQAIAEGVTFGDKMAARVANVGRMQSGSSDKKTAQDIFEERIQKMKAEKKQIDDLITSYLQLSTTEDANAKKTLSDAGINGIKETVHEKEKEKLKDFSDELLSIQRQNQQDEINLMREGSAKRLAQIELDYQKELDAIAKQKKEWRNAQDGKLTDEQYATLGIRQVNADAKKESAIADVYKDEENAMNQYLKEYGSWMQKREAITKEYTERINKAVTEGEKLSLGERMKRELAAVDEAAHGSTTMIARLFDDMSNKTVQDMRAIADEAEKMLAYLNTGKWIEKDGSGKDEFGLTKEQFDIYKGDASKLRDIKDEINNVRIAADEAEPVLKQLSKALKSVMSGDKNNFEQNLSVILDGVGKITKAAEFLGDSLSQISDAFGGNFLGGIAEGIGVATDAANAAMSGAEAGAVFGPWGAAAGAAIGAVSSLTSSLSKLHDKKHEKRIQRIQEQIEVMEKSYERLGDAIEDAYSKDASKLIDDQNKLLEQQKILIQQQIKEEEKKKKTDNDRIKEWRDQIDEINKTIKDNKEAAIDAIFGSDLQSAIEDFSSAYVDIWASGEDKAKSTKDLVKKLIKGMITESIKAAASDPMKAIREKLLEFWSDEYISGWEQDYLNRMESGLQKELDSKFGWANEYMSDPSYKQEASEKGFATMSQETGEELNGRFSALQVSNEEIKNHVAIINLSINEIKSINTEIKDYTIGIQDQLANHYLELMAINSNTDLAARYLKDIKTDISEVKENTKRL